MVCLGSVPVLTCSKQCSKNYFLFHCIFQTTTISIHADPKTPFSNKWTAKTPEKFPVCSWKWCCINNSLVSKLFVALFLYFFVRSYFSFNWLLRSCVLISLESVDLTKLKFYCYNRSRSNSFLPQPHRDSYKNLHENCSIIIVSIKPAAEISCVRQPRCLFNLYFQTVKRFSRGLTALTRNTDEIIKMECFMFIRRTAGPRYTTNVSECDSCRRSWKQLCRLRL